jgi:hypothetical protein
VQRFQTLSRISEPIVSFPRDALNLLRIVQHKHDMHDIFITLFQDVISTYLSVGFDHFISVRNCKCNGKVALCLRTATKTQTPTENQVGQFHTSTDLPVGVGTRDEYDAGSLPDGVWVLCQRENFVGSYRIKIYQRKLRRNI